MIGGRASPDPARRGGREASVRASRMSDIFQEVDEEVRRDKAAEFWKKYQNLILAAAAVVVLASAGFRYWQYERGKAAEAAGDQFQQALAALEGGKLDEAKAGFDTIAAKGPSGYRALAQMSAAGARAAKDPQGAIAAFDAVAGDASIDPLLRDAARLRAALALGALALERKDYDDAAKQFDRVMADPETSPDERQAAARWLGLVASNRSPPAK